MKALLFLFYLVPLCLFSQAVCSSHHVLVSVAPDQFFVEKIGGEKITVDLVVPTGASSHTYEPSPKQILQSSQADLWFTIGESFEVKALKVMQKQNPYLKNIDLRQGLELIYGLEKDSCKCCVGDGGVDVHFWLSARLALKQAKTIATALIIAYPSDAEYFLKRLALFEQELKELDQEITEILKPLSQRTILVSHPAYAYFCRDYALEQLSIEFEGKDPSPYQLTQLLNLAREKRIKTVFIQRQYHNKGAKLIAKELQAKIVTLDPYSGDYYQMMRQIAKSFAEQ